MITFAWLIGSAVIGVVAAWLAGQTLRGNGFGLAGNIIAGVLGAVVVGYAFRIAGLDLGGLPGHLIASFIGAAMVLVLVHLLTCHPNGQRSWS